MYIHNFLGKKVATSENFNENNHPMGENPPNLVTLRTCVWCGKSLKREIKSVLYFILTESRLIGAELTNIFIAHGLEQGRQMVNFRTKNPTLGIFWRAWEGKMLVYFIVIWNILRQFGYVLWPLGMFCGPWVLTFPFLGTSYQQQSGSPGLETNDTNIASEKTVSRLSSR
jgi:hypothetical protein